MLIEHAGNSPRIHPTAWVAPTATICGDVEVGPDSRVLFGAVLTADGGPIRIGSQCVVMENGVLRVAVGDPATVLPPDRHDEISAIQERIDFPKEVFGVDRSPDMMAEIMGRYTRGLERHVADRVIEE